MSNFLEIWILFFLGKTDRLAQQKTVVIVDNMDQMDRSLRDWAWALISLWHSINHLGLLVFSSANSRSPSLLALAVMAESTMNRTGNVRNEEEDEEEDYMGDLSQFLPPETSNSSKFSAKKVSLGFCKNPPQHLFTLVLITVNESIFITFVFQQTLEGICVI